MGAAAAPHRAVRLAAGQVSAPQSRKFLAAAPRGWGSAGPRTAPYGSRGKEGRAGSSPVRRVPAGRRSQVPSAQRAWAGLKLHRNTVRKAGGEEGRGTTSGRCVSGYGNRAEDRARPRQRGRGESRGGARPAGPGERAPTAPPRRGLQVRRAPATQGAGHAGRRSARFQGEGGGASERKFPQKLKLGRRGGRLALGGLTLRRDLISSTKLYSCAIRPRRPYGNTTVAVPALFHFSPPT